MSGCMTREEQARALMRAELDAADRDHGECPNCYDPLNAGGMHESNGCVLIAFAELVRERGGHTPEQIAELVRRCNADRLWDVLGPIVDRFEEGEFNCVEDDEITTISDRVALPPNRREELIRALALDSASCLDSLDHKVELLTNGHLGFQNYTDNELLEAAQEAGIDGFNHEGKGT